MTRKSLPPDDEALTELAAEGFAALGELVPTTEAEVARAERAGVEFEGELPPGLSEYRPPAQGTEPARAPRREAPEDQPAPPSQPASTRAPDSVVSLEDARRRRTGRATSWSTHLVAAALGAAAATALFVSREPRNGPAGGVPSSEPASPRKDAGPDAKIQIGPVQRCEACCAGAKCASAQADLAQCSSGRQCIACSTSELTESRYRVRLGAFAPHQGGKAWFDSTKGQALDLCVRVGSSPFACAPAHATTEGAEQWTSLPLMVTAQDALAGFVLEVRPRGAQNALAKWQSPVTINATTLCKGLFIKPKTDKDEALGVVSAFLDDSYYVELSRSDSVDELVDRRRRLELGDLTPRVFETSKPGDQRFALVVGPLDKQSSEKLRWALLEKKQDARIVAGDDHVGPPRPSDH